MTEFLGFIAPDIETAIHSYIAAKFGRWDDDDQYIEPDVETVRAWALETAKMWAKQRRSNLDDIVSDNITLAIEIAIYFINDRPADPQPGIYVIANAMAVRREVTLRVMLENLLTRWRAIQAEIANVMAELDRLLDEINTASTVTEIEAVLASVAWDG